MPRTRVFLDAIQTKTSENVDLQLIPCVTSMDLAALCSKSHPRIPECTDRY